MIATVFPYILVQKRTFAGAFYRQVNVCWAYRSLSWQIPYFFLEGLTCT